jgi:hypothetical protein
MVDRLVKVTLIFGGFHSRWKIFAPIPKSQQNTCDISARQYCSTKQMSVYLTYGRVQTIDIQDLLFSISFVLK